MCHKIATGIEIFHSSFLSCFCYAFLFIPLCYCILFILPLCYISLSFYAVHFGEVLLGSFIYLFSTLTSRFGEKVLSLRLNLIRHKSCVTRRNLRNWRHHKALLAVGATFQTAWRSPI
jgi:hypothetical protein